MVLIIILITNLTSVNCKLSRFFSLNIQHRLQKQIL